MTARERTAAAMLVAGTVLLLVAAYAYDGWRAAVAVAGVLAVAGGVLLGMDDAPAPQVAGDELIP